MTETKNPVYLSLTEFHIKNPEEIVPLLTKYGFEILKTYHEACNQPKGIFVLLNKKTGLCFDLFHLSADDLLDTFEMRGGILDYINTHQSELSINAKQNYSFAIFELFDVLHKH